MCCIVASQSCNELLRSFWWQLLDCDDKKMVEWLREVCELQEHLARNCTAGLREKLETTNFLAL